MIEPLTEVRGARSSWLTIARNSARSRSSSFSGVMSCTVATYRSNSPFSVRMGVALMQGRHRSVLRQREGDLLASYRLAELGAPPPGRSHAATPRARPPGAGSGPRGVPRATDRDRWTSTSLASPPGWPTPWPPLLRRRTTTPTGAVFTRVSRSASGPLHIAVLPGVGDDQRRLRGEHDQRLDILLAERLIRPVMAQPDDSREFGPMSHRRSQARKHVHWQLRYPDQPTPRIRGSSPRGEAPGAC